MPLVATSRMVGRIRSGQLFRAESGATFILASWTSDRARTRGFRASAASGRLMRQTCAHFHVIKCSRRQPKGYARRPIEPNREEVMLQSVKTAADTVLNKAVNSTPGVPG